MTIIYICLNFSTDGLKLNMNVVCHASNENENKRMLFVMPRTGTKIDVAHLCLTDMQNTNMQNYMRKKYLLRENKIIG